MPARKRPIPSAKSRAVDSTWQRREYDRNMQVKRGELLWDEQHEGHGFGSHGEYVDPSEWLARRIPTDELRIAVEAGTFYCPTIARVLNENGNRKVPETLIRYANGERVAA